MPIYDNSYTNSYIRITGCVITYNLSKAGFKESETEEDKIYNVQDCYTNKKYIYWNIKNPNILEFSNKILEKGLGAGRYLIVINDNGTHTQYINNNNPEISVSFEGDSTYIVEKKVWGLYEQVDDLDGKYVEKFANITSDIDGIKQSVGVVETTANSIKETVSKFDQKADAIISSVGSKTKKFVNDELRDEAYNVLIPLATELGLLLSNIKDVYLSDMQLNEEEKIKIRDSLKVLSSKKIEVNKCIDKILLICKPGKLKTILQSSQSELNERHAELVTLLDRILELIGKIERNDMDLITDKFGSYNTSINNVKNAIDDAIIETLGGTIEESISTIEQTANGLVTTVAKKVDKDGVKEITKSTIEQSADEVLVAFNKIDSASVSITSRGLEVSNGRIKTDAIIPGTFNRIVLEDGYTAGDNNCMSIDTNTGGIRLKKNSTNYIKVSSAAIDFYLNGRSYRMEDYDSSTLNLNNMLIQSASGIAIKAANGYSETYLRIRSGGSMSSYINGSEYNHSSISDINLKENIFQVKVSSKNIKSNILKSDLLLNENEKNFSNIDISLDDLHDFLNKDLKLYQYNFNDKYYEGDIDNVKNKLKFGFIAQDVIDTKLGKLIFNSGDYQYEESNYISVIAGALQIEIKKREELESKVNQLNSLIDQLKGE
nr:hypothetical protein [Clostridioides sp.]